MNISGIKECIAAIEGIKLASEATAKTIVRRSEAALEAEIKKGFTEQHQRGTPTPSNPGEPPAVITGTLRRSIVSSVPAPLHGGGAEGKVYPTAVYARIQELGGGNNLPARPYVAPAYDRTKHTMSMIAEEEWARATRV